MANLLVSAVRRRRIREEDVETAGHLIEALPIEIHTPMELARIRPWAELALASRLTAYDASYLALAEQLRAGLATEDEDLAVAARSRQVPLWGKE